MKKTNRWKGWTPKEVEQVDFLVRGGANIKEIAEQMDGRTEGAIYYIIYRKRHIYLSWRSRQKVRALRRREDRRANGRVKEEDKAPVTSDLSEIASVADNNRIRLGMSDMAIIVGAMCSFATLVLLSLVVAFA